ncbi:MAG: quercetin 2,3-dioxygenase [Methylophilaceae bacterium 17-44-8]|nr:MAG: quercetin 2,3-dioxygenase [Methylophilaceae bacterium 17-44-8]
MITLRKSQARGHANHGWLDSYHSFSFAEYYDSAHMQYSVLRVINEDKVAPGTGFGMHGHRDMEIITYMLGGEIEHQDSMGNGAVIKAGDVQRMSAGTGVRHSEVNASDNTEAHLLQIWLLPSQQGLPPSYEDKTIPYEQKLNQWRLIASPTARSQSLMIQQDVELWATILDAHHSITYDIQSTRCGYLQVARGQVKLNGQLLSAGDAAMIDAESHLQLQALEESELLLFDLPSEHQSTAFTA